VSDYKDKLIYLASPYSHTEHKVRIERFHRIAIVAAELMKSGYFLFCPITHTHPINEAGVNNPGWEFWCKYDCCMLDRCQELWIADMEGWNKSVGVTAEIQYMMEANKPVYLFNHANVIEGLPVKLIEQYNPFISQRI
jgi:hypothetical protein